MEHLAPPRDALDLLSREFALACDKSGRVSWVDARAARLLGLRPGDDLFKLATPGTEGKLEAMLLRAAREMVQDWEIALVFQRRPVTVSLSAMAQGREMLLVGHLVPEHFSNAIGQLAESMQEVVSLNRQVVGQKKEIERRHRQVLALNQELREAYQGVLTMHSELEDRATELRQVADLRTRIVSNVSHEFRTPLHSILGLARLLADGTDGELGAEQAKQVGFIRASAEELMQLVDDLLDLSKAEAGKASLRAERFELTEFFGSLRGMLKPLLPEGSPVALVFEPPAARVELETDKAKVSQVLRNLVSNALKFTEQGEVRVAADVAPEGMVRIRVSDTGIGIRPEDTQRVFEEFAQVDSPLQARVKGSGIGLPLSRRLAQLLGGSLALESEPGRGSTFTFTFPREHAEVREMQRMVERSRAQPAGPASILVVEDDRKTLFIYEKYLLMAGFHVLPARSLEEARRIVHESRPAAVVLDIMLEGETSWSFLAELKRNPQTRDIPVLVVTVTNGEQKARALGADEFWFKPIDQERLLRRLSNLARPGVRPRILVIDDDERARYIVRKHLGGLPYHVIEAQTGAEGVVLAQEQAPHVILLDFLLKEVTAFDVLDELKSDPRTRAIPVIIVTSHVLDVGQQRRLLEEADGVISKQSLSRELAINRIRDALLRTRTSRAAAPG